jgi:NAD(P)H-flavin reductase
MLYLFGAGEVAISISGDPARGDELVHTVRAVGSVTTPLCTLRRGAQLGVRGPFGAGWPLAEAEGGDVVVVAGGLGLAPLRPAVYHLLRHRERYRRVAILVGARTPEELLYRRELPRWRKPGVELLVTVDRAGPDWDGHVGVVAALVDDLARAWGGLDGPATTAMVCGPEVMMRFTARALADRGLVPARTFLSMERNMKCAVGLCGHCQYGPLFICKDGPVLRLDRIAWLLDRREI